MIRTNLLSTLAVFVGLATCGCGSEPGIAHEENVVAEAPSVPIDGANGEGSQEMEGRAGSPAPTLSTQSHPLDLPDSTGHLRYGPFPQPWTAEER